MPVYAYKCRACDSEFEVKQKFSDDPITDCQLCGTHESVHRVIQPAGIVFKGSGWYVTDSRGDRKNLTSKTDASASNGTSTKTETPSDAGAKPSVSESKPESKPKPAQENVA
jgi:putative FmdB family regulatory protein